VWHDGGKRRLNRLAAALDGMEGVWAPVLSTTEVIEDEQALVNGIVSPVQIDGSQSYLASTPPGQFDEQLIGDLTASPAHGQHTEEILLEFGLEWDQIADLKERGAIM
jgi:crotonobetainyl-CoA:carnitine CoA-transferase CaiB-like acyl-CoA transferase